MPLTLSSQIYKAALEAKDSTWNLFYSSAESHTPHDLLSLKVPNVEFVFDVSVDSVQFLTDTSKT